MEDWKQVNAQGIKFNREALPLHIVTTNVGRLTSFIIRVTPNDNEMVTLIFDDNTKAEYVLEDKVLHIVDDLDISISPYLTDEKMVDFTFDEYPENHFVNLDESSKNSIRASLISPFILEEAA